MLKEFTTPLRNERGQGMMEYVLIAIVIGLIVLFAAGRFGSSVRERFSAAGDAVENTKIKDGEVADASGDAPLADIEE